MNNPATSVASAVAGGGANELLVQTATSTTGFVPAPTTAGQVLEWNGSSIGWAAVTSAVSSFNGRTGAVVPQSGDYTAAEVGAPSISQFASFQYPSGYQLLPGGLILQWGSVNGTSSPQYITFPYQFPNACFVVVAGNTQERNSVTCSASQWTQTSFKLDQTNYAAWFAIGN
jgi:hypothetical protein